MSDPLNRDELAARLEAAEARTETRFVELSAELKAVALAVSSLNSNVTDQRRENRTDNTFTRWTIAGIVITSALAVVGIVIATQGTMTTANGNVLSALQAGLSVQAASVPAAPPAQPVTQQPAPAR